ncbi:long-chain specific acyl-CoA dehydrogenase, mitochondrial isoform X3 [Trachypithecus francoisi]|uniref:long-chain specific acyl-CoA dehydrogenase, mitochondrial isoform X3 n=1 Tax=Trachypithecus francoisi TaxID=54180 RepID=UPI00141AF6CB|nr:long-chain specific acyl-CoA dehydrogenase, mitochondrial isoform X3 [Trachypithecus francoisi]
MAARLLRGSLRFMGGHCAARPLPAVRCSHSGGEERLETPSARNLTDIGIRRIFSSEHDIFRKSIRRFFQEEVIPHHSEWEKAGEVSREVWEKAGKQGLLGVNIAEHLGGIGGDLYYAAVVWEEQAYSNCSGPGFSVHSGIVMSYITNYGSEEQIKHFIPQMTAGKCIGAIAMTEPGAGSDLQGIKTNAKKDGSDWILNGSKDTAELFFEDVRLPASALLGEENKGFYYIMKELPQERLLIADMAISASEFMFEETRNYVKQRKAFGKTVAHLQTVQHKLAELKTHICVTRAFVDNCLQLHEAKRLDSATACMAKYWASELQNSVAYDCVQLHGGWGYMWEYPIAKRFTKHSAKIQLPFKLCLCGLCKVVSRCRAVLL